MEGIEQKIKKLLILADPERGATEEEAATALEKAQEVASKYGIELASVSLEENNDPIDVEDEYLSLNQSGVWRRTLANDVAKSMGAKTIWLKDYGSHSGNLHIFAPKGTVRSIIATYRSIENWIDITSVSATENRPDPFVHGRTYRISWIEGCVERIRVRLLKKAQRLKDQATQDNKSQALVKVGSDVEASRAQKYPNIVRTKRQRRVGDYGAYIKGKEAGNNAAIGDPELNR